MNGYDLDGDRKFAWVVENAGKKLVDDLRKYMDVWIQRHPDARSVYDVVTEECNGRPDEIAWKMHRYFKGIAFDENDYNEILSFEETAMENLMKKEEYSWTRAECFAIDRMVETWYIGHLNRKDAGYNGNISYEGIPWFLPALRLSDAINRPRLRFR